MAQDCEDVQMEDGEDGPLLLGLMLANMNNNPNNIFAAAPISDTLQVLNLSVVLGHIPKGDGCGTSNNKHIHTRGFSACPSRAFQAKSTTLDLEIDSIGAAGQHDSGLTEE